MIDLDVNLILTAKITMLGIEQWESYCPEIDIYSYGESELEARYNLKGAAELWLYSCIERRTLKEALSEVD